MTIDHQSLKVCPCCESHRRVQQVEGVSRCDSCGGELVEGPPPRRGALSRLARATRGGLVAGALIALAAVSAGCGDSDTKTDARQDAGVDIPIATPYGISPVMIDELLS